MDALLRDSKHSIRVFLKNRSFTLTAVLTLALGIGATTAIFSVVNAVLLRPLPVFDPDRLVMFINTWVSETGERKSFLDASPSEFADWRTQSDVTQHVSAFAPGVMNYTAGDQVEQVHSMEVSVDFFRCWGIDIIRGRTFTQEEDLPRGPRVAVISRHFWSTHSGSNPITAERTIRLNDEAYVVIGVAGGSSGLSEFGPPPDVYVPFQLDPHTTDEGSFFKVVARLKPGVTLNRAKSRLQASVTAYRAKLPRSSSFGPTDSFTVLPFREALVGDTRPLLLILLSSVALVLLIACSNVANLLLVRATGRRREIAIRAAIGAARGTVVRQMLTESVLLSIAGGGLGMLLGYGGIRALLAVNTANLPFVGQNGSAVNIDWRVTMFAIVVSLITGIAFGLVPAIQSSRVDLLSSLKDSSGRSGTGLRQNKAHAAIVVSEMGMATILLVGSALLIRSFVALYNVHRGFETKNVVTMRTSLAGPKYLKSVGHETLIRSSLHNIRSLPDVVAASATCCLPLLQGFYGQPFEIIGKPPRNAHDTPAGGWSVVSPGFFEVFQIPLKRGRTFNDRDDGRAPQVVIINQRMADEYWKDKDPLQDRIEIGRGMMEEFKDDPRRQIVGIVGDVRNERLNADPLPMMYVPQAQLPDAENAWLFRNGQLAWVVRTKTESRQSVSLIRDRLKQTTGLPVSNILSMDEVLTLSTGKQRFNMLLMTAFGWAALLLAAIGIYGVMAFTVEQRTHEIGIRLAIGADGKQVRNMVIREGLSLALIGVVGGLCAAWGLSRLMESLIFGVKAQDPWVFVASLTVLIAVAFLAVWLPASRASQVSPLHSLRYE